MKHLILFLLLTNVTLGATRYNIRTIAGIEIKTGVDSWEELTAAGKNPKYVHLILDSTGGIAGMAAVPHHNGTPYTPPVGRKYLPKMLVNTSATAVVHQMYILSCTNSSINTSTCTSPIYIGANQAGSGYPRLNCYDATFVCEVPIYDVEIPNGRYLAANVIAGAGRNLQIYGYEVDI